MYYVSGNQFDVLILVLMEDALRAVGLSLALALSRGLNPCSNGRCSASIHTMQ